MIARIKAMTHAARSGMSRGDPSMVPGPLVDRPVRVRLGSRRQHSWILGRLFPPRSGFWRTSEPVAPAPQKGSPALASAEGHLQRVSEKLYAGEIQLRIMVPSRV